MNILFFLTRFPGVGGIENVTTEIVCALAEKLSEGSQIFILSYCQDEGVCPVGCSAIFKMPDSIVYDSPSNRQYFSDILVNNQIDAIIYQDSYAPSEKLVIEIAKANHIPVYVFEHNSPLGTVTSVSKWNFSSFQQLIKTICIPIRRKRIIDRKKYLLENCKKYVLLSTNFIPEFLKLVGDKRNKNKVIAIHNPLRFKEKNIFEKDNRILFVGRLEQVKRLDLCLDYWQKIQDRLIEWQFDIVGDGSLRSKFEEMSKDMKLNRVHFHGFQNPDSYYAKSKIFWMTSDFEGWGLTLVEAMNRGCVPIVRNTFSAISDIIPPDSGITTPPHNSLAKRAFIDSSVMLAEHNQQWEAMSKNAIKSAQRFHIDNIIEQWIELLAD